ncbi:MAG: sodium:alanine symporter family protein [Chlamydiia bacterium]|nr:sodium:alanine symporter family protein [Chlamydiia bacterium]
MDALFSLIENINHLIWSHLAFVLIVLLGGYFSMRSRFFQIRKFGMILLSFFLFFRENTKEKRGIHPLKAFFAAIGGCIGIGNVVGICTAVQIGGPGALLWTWIGGLCGMLIQYAEAYLGLKHRVKNSSNNYDGGPMYFLPLAYKSKWIAPVVSILLCIYGVEIFMFNVMAESMSVNWGIDLRLIVAILLVATIVVALGGIKRVGEVCSAIIPLFVVLYLVMCIWVLIAQRAELPLVLQEIVRSAFTGKAAEGGFIGSTTSLAISMGISRGAYSGDIGIGYTSIIYAESRTKEFERLSSLTILGIFLDTFVICTLSVLVVLATDYWKSGIDVSLMVQEALGLHFPYMPYFMPLFLFLLGYTTILSYFVVGVKCAKFLSPRKGPLIYYLYACIMLPLFAFTKPLHAFSVMSLAGALLLLFNLYGILRLRKEIKFGLDRFDV